MNIIKKATISILLIIISLFSVIIIPLTASAAVLTYSDVLEDLREDSSFDVTKYPLMTYDYFSALNSDEDETNDVEYLSVIHIAESEDKELFVYSYQPLNNVSDITASSINIATVENAMLNMELTEDATNFEKYTLKCVSYDGPFKKYLVEDFVVPNEFYRYYCISEIERPFDTLLDEKISNETITDFKAHKVGQAWCCYYQDSELKYEMVTLDVVEITPTHTGELYYENGITWGSLVGIKSSCVSHYISFNIENYDVDKIIDASLEYKYRDYRTVHTLESGIAPTISSWFGKDTEHTITTYPNGMDYITKLQDIYEVDVVDHEGEGLWAKDYSWNRIMTGESFVDQFEDQGGEWNETIKTTVKNSHFVFAFTETEITSSQTSSSTGTDQFATTTYTTVVEGTEVAQVDILRLKFVSNGITYNLGVVGDTTSSDGVADGVADGLEIDFDFDTGFEKIMAVVLLILLIIVFTNVVFPITKPIIKILFKGISFVLNALFNIFIIPLRLIFGSNRK